jgi:predicted DNA-binding protein with PD1-like motif
MVHAHVTFSDDEGVCYAGHLSGGTIIFACEFIITVCRGASFVRDLDEQTGLPLWKF